MKAAVVSTDVSASAEAGRDLASQIIDKLGAPAQAIILGAASRDPNGLRRSVVFIENSSGELCSGAAVAFRIQPAANRAADLAPNPSGSRCNRTGFCSQ